MRLREPDVVWLSILWIGACSEEQPSSNKPPEESSHSEATHETSGRNPTEEQQPATRTDVVTSSSDDEASAAVNSEPVAEGSPDAGVVVRAITGVGSRCDRASRIGALGVTLTSDRTIISGSVSNGTTPSSVPQVTAEAGGCQLLIPRSLFCTSCSVNETCAGDERCVAKPTKVSAGTLRVDGMLADVEVMPNGITLDYSKTVLDPYPAYEVGSNIEMRAAGDVVERFDGSLWGGL